MIRRTHKRASILQHERDAVTYSLIYALGLFAYAQPPVHRGTEESRSACAWHQFNTTRCPICLQHGRSLCNAGRAAVSNDVETKLLKIRQEASTPEIFCDHHRTGRETRLDSLANGESFFHRPLCKQSSCHHHGRVARVGAARDCGNYHVPISESVLFSFHLELGVFFFA